MMKQQRTFHVQIFHPKNICICSFLMALVLILTLSGILYNRLCMYDGDAHIATGPCFQYRQYSVPYTRVDAAGFAGVLCIPYQRIDRVLGIVGDDMLSTVR